jgi:hypothetical protein
VNGRTDFQERIFKTSLSMMHTVGEATPHQSPKSKCGDSRPRLSAERSSALSVGGAQKAADSPELTSPSLAHHASQPRSTPQTTQSPSKPEKS